MNFSIFISRIFKLSPKFGLAAVVVDVSGSIQGLNDIFATFVADGSEPDNPEAEAAFDKEFRNLSQPSPNMDISDDFTPIDSSDSTSAEKLKNSRYENAETSP